MIRSLSTCSCARWPKAAGRVKEGSALLLSLVFIVILTLIAVLIISITSLEEMTSVGQLRQVQARTLLDYAVDEVAGKLEQLPLGVQWAAAPGRIRFYNPSYGGDSVSGSANWEKIDLYSGESSSQDSNESVALNVRTARGWTIVAPNAEFGTAPPPFRVAWKYVLQDGTIVGRLSEADFAANPAVGRFAYWTDIENGRVNVNTAGFADVACDYNPASSDPKVKVPQNLTGHPSSVDLSKLEGVTPEQSLATFQRAGSYFLNSQADALTQSIPFFQTPADWQLVVDRDTFLQNQFYITHQGRTPEQNPWGINKLSLSLQAQDSNQINSPNLEGLRRPLTETYTANERLTLVPDVPSGAIQGNRSRTYVRQTFSDLGARSFDLELADAASNQDGNQSQISALIKTLVDYMKLEWPGFEGRTFRQKYAVQSSEYTAMPADYPIEQLAMDIIAHVDSLASGSLGGKSQTTTTSRLPLDKTLEGYDNMKLGEAIIYGRAIPKAPSGTYLSGSAGGPALNEIGVVFEPRTSLPAVFDSASTGPFPERGRSFPNYSIAFLSSPPASGKAYVVAQPRLELMYPFQNGQMPFNVNASNPPGAVPFPLGDVDYGNYLFFITDIEAKVVETGSAGNVLQDYTQRFDFETDRQLTGDARGMEVLGYFGPYDLMPLMNPGPGQISYAVTNVHAGSMMLFGPFEPDSSVSITLTFRVVLAANRRSGGVLSAATRLLSQVPGTFRVTDVTPTNTEAAEFLSFPAEIDLTDALPMTVSHEVNDPRVSRRKQDWGEPSEGTLGSANDAFTGDATGLPVSDYSRPPLALASIKGKGLYSRLGRAQSATEILGLPGIGHLSSVPNGVASQQAWATLDFGPTPASSFPPDWLLWDLFMVPYDRTFQGTTDGKININAALIPFTSGNDFLTRKKPLEALFGNRVRSLAGSPVDAAALSRNVAERRLAGAAADSGPKDMYIYPGQICQILGVADTGSNEYEREAIVRDIAGIVTTQCSDFRVFAVAQVLKQTGVDRVAVQGEQRAEVTLSRLPDVGERGYAFSWWERVLSPGQARPLNVVQRNGAVKDWEAYISGQTAVGPVDALNIDSGRYRTVLGLDTRPNTADDFFMPQKIQISGLKFLQ